MMQETRVKPLHHALGLGIVAVGWFIVLMLVSQFTNAYVERLVVLVGIYMILTVALNLSNGFTGVFSLGHIGFMAIGGYWGTLMLLPPPLKNQGLLPDLPPSIANLNMGVMPDLVAVTIAMISGGLIAAFIAFVIGLPFMRLKGHFVAVATMGFLIIIRTILVEWDTVTRGARGLSGVPNFNIYWFVWAWVLITIYVVWRVTRSPYGRAMMAVRENELAAQSVGVDVLRARIIAYTVSAFLTAAAGVLFAVLLSAIAPVNFYWIITFQVIVMLVVGGMGSISGSLMGALIMTVIPEVLRTVESGITIGGIELPATYGLAQIVIGVIFVLLMIFRRQGIMGTRELVPGRWIAKLFGAPREQQVPVTGNPGSGPGTTSTKD